MDIKFKYLVPSSILALLLLLVGCSLDFGDTSTPTTEAVSSSEPVSMPEGIPLPEAGTPVLWADFSYVVFIPAGEFIMGQEDTQPVDYSPAHTVSLAGFWIHQTEVTNSQYAQCVDAGVCTPPTAETGAPYWFSLPGFSNHPVIDVDWFQAQTYCEWMEGSLATEAQWEKAARGTLADPYPWGSDEPVCDLLNFEGCFDPPEPQKVRSYALGASFFNLADTAGNVFEWVLDYYQDDYYAVSPASNPPGPSTGEERVIRGSSYLTPQDEIFIYRRSSHEPDEYAADLGFRCILTQDVLQDPPPPPCDVTAIYIPPLDQPTTVPAEYPIPGANIFCMISQNNTPYGVVNLDFGQPINQTSYVITSSIGTPIVNWSPSYPNLLTVTNVPLETTFQLTVCPSLIPPAIADVSPSCPPGYSFSPSSNRCHFGHNPDIPYMCADDAVDIPGFGCLPEVECGLCPVGYFPGEYEGQEVCIPVGIPDLYTLVDCLEGYEYDPDNACCILPPATYDPTCPPGFIFDPITSYCVSDYEEEPCRTFTLYIPTCEEPTPIVCVNPGSYTTKSTCEAAHCKWEDPAVRDAFCTYP